MLRHRFPSQQQGVVLFIALIVMVAMLLASVALLRSTDSGSEAANNRILAQSATYATSIGMELMTKKLTDKVKNQNAWKNLNDDIPADCYYASAFRRDLDTDMGLNEYGIPNRLAEEDPVGTSKLHANCRKTLSNTGETLYFIADRQCRDTGPLSTKPDTATGRGNLCLNNRASTIKDAGNDDQQTQGSTGGSEHLLVRVTVRVDGPRNTRAYAQSLIEIFDNPNVIKATP